MPAVSQRCRSGFGHRDEDDSRDLPDDESRPDGRAKRRRTVKAVRRRAEPRGGPSGVPVTERPPRGEPLVGWPERAVRRASKPRAATARIRERRRQGAKPHKRWPTWQQAGPLADRDRASPRSSRAPPRGGERSKDVGGAGRRRKGARATRLVNEVGGGGESLPRSFGRDWRPACGCFAKALASRVAA